MVYKIICSCGTREVTKEEFEKNAGKEALNELKDKMEKGESIGGMLVFDNGCPECVKGEHINANLFSIKKETVI
ncbi:MAG: hypothetical protein PHG66_05190 [Candidatus Colwellbacteria bacterium]|nr:hypothetical protein [Candidatus Colwellbacteria bacterium]